MNKEIQIGKSDKVTVLEETKSLCPKCQKVVNAVYFEQNNQIWLEKYCKNHGLHQELISTDAEFYKKILERHYEITTPIESPITESVKGCPYDCGLCDKHLSASCLVNIDLTNRCNLNCPICFANANQTGVAFDFPFEKLKIVLENLATQKPAPLSIQFAGGEPTVYKHFLDAIRMAKGKGFLDVQAATNGVKFAKDLQFAHDAREAGLDVAYLQFDGISDEIYQETRGRPMFEIKQKAIENCRKAGIMVVLVPTLAQGLNNHELGDILNFAIQNSDIVTAVSFQPISFTGRIEEEKRKQMHYTLTDLARDTQDQTEWLDMYRDWYPFSVASPISRFLEAIDGKKQIKFTCSPKCGLASYIFIDKNSKRVTPLTKFMNVESAVREINEDAQKREKHPWINMLNLSQIQLKRILKRNFKESKAPLSLDEFIEFIQKLMTARAIEGQEKVGHVYHKAGNHLDVMMLTSMHFQDNWNIDLHRLQHCVIHYATPDGKLYPFCTYNSGPCHRYRVEEKESHFEKTLL